MQGVKDFMKIFSSVRQSVIGLDSKSYSIVFANPAAKNAFGLDPTGRLAKEFVSIDVVEENADDYLCGTTIMGRRASISVVKEADIILLFIDFLSDAKPSLTLSRYMINSLRNSAMGIKLSADRCFSMLEDGRQPSEKHISVLYHYYYSLLRTLIQIDSADLIERGELPFSPELIDLVKLCSDVTKMVATLCAETGVDINFTSDKEEFITAVDPARIEQLLLNLFSNSLQHTVSGNTITLSLNFTGSKIIMSLDDDGEGIPPESISNIFKLPDDNGDDFIKKKGSGLGLYIALGIAQQHKGVILVESREGKGTCVRVMLPSDENTVQRFNSPDTPYRHDYVSPVLTELSDLLSSASYGPKYED
ncbi:MAG: HAMP domain-containing sensor histidine kinase [Oscillospiraceae bacterium]|nr:HAMP domain-containing sensor histidine kinase [Oscillospiraceae bacterium]